jgi:hypothetical protein
VHVHLFDLLAGERRRPAAGLLPDRLPKARKMKQNPHLAGVKRIGVFVMTVTKGAQASLYDRLPCRYFVFAEARPKVLLARPSGRAREAVWRQIW